MKFKFKPGDKVYSKKYGKGFCHQVDEQDKDFTYDFHFKDGTIIWMSRYDGERYVKCGNHERIIYLSFLFK
mgnify:CR=1 FL=1